MLSDDATRGRLLHESSTRAFAALRMRAMGSLARIRAITLGAFCLVAIAFSIAGDPASRAELGPLLAYTLSGYLLLRWRRGGGWREHLTMSSPMSGVVLALIAVVSAAVVRELDRMVARLVVNEVSHEELRRAQDEAETLTHLLVHDMKGPLTGLIGLAEVVASELKGPLQTDVKMIEQQGRRLQVMVGDLLAIARLERGVLSSAPESVDLSALLVSLANAYAVSARNAGAQITAKVEGGLCASLHREMIHRFFDNLVLNALDFVRPGGRVEVAAWQEGPELLLAVRNTGDPVPVEARARLFQKGAVQRSRQKHNLGLGLYLCRLVAVAHDGAIMLREEPGWSTSFVARLPVEARRLVVDFAPALSRVGNA